MKPTLKTKNPCFSSGPCAKRPGWSLQALQDAPFGRSHRSKPGKAKLKAVIDLTRDILGVPADYKIGIVPASDTGAVEMALWTMIGTRGVDVLAWESFGSGWASDIKSQLKITDLNIYNAEYGELPDLSKVDFSRDVVFTWNGTTSGVCVPDGNWISDTREGLTICDATSAVFAMDLPWKKLDVITYSWQKVMGGEAAHGVIILSPRAVARLESYTPSWPIPKIFALTKGGKLIDGIFQGDTINTPSMLCVEDALDGLQWAKSIGGLPAVMARTKANFDAIKQWVASSNWIAFLASDLSITSSTSVCLKIKDSWYLGLSKEEQELKAKELVSIIEKEQVAYDIGAYRDAPPGIRIWAGATVETADIKTLIAWLDWAFNEIKLAKAA